jgi:antirestriction protein ArdC
MQDIRQTVTNTIIEALSNGGLPPWRKPWADDPNAPGLHTSLSTTNPYRGINQILLMVAAMRFNFTSKWWGTFNQINQHGASVQKGQKGTHVILFKRVERTKVDESGDEVKDNFAVMRSFVVFNADQTTGLEKFKVGFGKPQIDEHRYENAEAAIAAIGADIRFGGNQAFYNMQEDYIQLPHRHQFETPEAFLETSLHEHCHWTEKRVGFDRSQAENTYALGEMVAEIGSCLMMAELNLPTSTANHAAYLKNWLDGMAGDSRFIFKAAAQSSKAVDYLLSFSRTPAAPKPVEEPVLA